MLAARARVPFACMIWQVVPSTSTRKSINLDLARAAPYRYFTQYGPAHADQNLFQQTSFIASFLSVSLVVLLYGVGRSGWTRRCRAGLLTSPTRTHRHVHTLTHTRPYHTNSSRFLFILIHRSNPRTRYGILANRNFSNCGNIRVWCNFWCVFYLLLNYICCGPHPCIFR